MLRTFELLQNSIAVKRFEILDFKSAEKIYYLKIRADIKNNAELFIREYYEC